MKHEPHGIYERIIKRPMDCILASIAFVLLSPVMGLTALTVGIKFGRPLIFTQERPGKNEKIFNLYKFRTMTDERDEDDTLLPDEERLTKFGRFLRSTSIDELPELINIIKGDMAIVGPRPLLVSYLPRYTEHQKRRHEVRPGLTGLAQVHGRNSVSWEDRFDLDVEYVDNITFFGDVRVAFGTIKLVLSREGINSQNAATMEEYQGSCINRTTEDNRS